MADELQAQSKSNLRTYLKVVVTLLAISFVVNVYFSFTYVGQIVGNQTINQNVPKEFQDQLTNCTTNLGTVQSQLNTVSQQLNTTSNQLNNCQNKLALAVITVSGAVQTSQYTTPTEISFLGGINGKYVVTVTNGQYTTRLPNNDVYTATVGYNIGGLMPSFRTCSPQNQLSLYVTDISQKSVSFDVSC